MNNECKRLATALKPQAEHFKVEVKHDSQGTFQQEALIYTSLNYMEAKNYAAEKTNITISCLNRFTLGFCGQFSMSSATTAPRLFPTVTVLNSLQL